MGGSDYLNSSDINNAALGCQIVSREKKGHCFWAWSKNISAIPLKLETPTFLKKLYSLAQTLFGWVTLSRVLVKK